MKKMIRALGIALIGASLFSITGCKEEASENDDSQNPSIEENQTESDDGEDAGLRIEIDETKNVSRLDS